MEAARNQRAHADGSQKARGANAIENDRIGDANRAAAWRSDCNLPPPPQPPTPPPLGYRNVWNICLGPQTVYVYVER